MKERAATWNSILWKIGCTAQDSELTAQATGENFSFFLASIKANSRPKYRSKYKVTICMVAFEGTHGKVREMTFDLFTSEATIQRVKGKNKNLTI